MATTMFRYVYSWMILSVFADCTITLAFVKDPALYCSSSICYDPHVNNSPYGVILIGRWARSGGSLEWDNREDIFVLEIILQTYKS